MTTPICGDSQAIPTTPRKPGAAIDKLKQLSMGFIAGAECLDDLDRLRIDQGFSSACSGRPYGAKTIGNFLRNFNEVQCKFLNIGTAKSGFRIRSIIDGEPKPMTFDIDSTFNEQYGKYMEGVEYNYSGFRSLSTIQVFDEIGLQYWNDVRPGATHTAKNSEEIIHRVFEAMPPALRELKHTVRADSGYCKLSFMLSCSVKNANFVVCMRSLMYRPLVSRVSNWEQ